MKAGAAIRPAQGDGVVLSHPSGNQFFRHLAGALRDARRLAQICTCIDWRGGNAGRRILPARFAAELERRSFSEALGVSVAQHPWHEAGRLVASRLGLHALTRHETGVFSVDAVYRDFDRWVARRLRHAPGAGIAYAYEDAAEATFREAARLGWQRVYDLPIAHWRMSRQLLDEESIRYPHWEPTLVGTRDSTEKNDRKDRELELANVVVCPSRFVADSLPPDVRLRKRVVVAPFGAPPTRTWLGARDTGKEGRLRVLFAGSMTQRKGLADLFAALRQLRRADIELVVLGSPLAPMAFYHRELPGFSHAAPRPHDEVLTLMRTCDVLCLPSIVEGRALVVAEAMSQGLPVVVTSHTGTADVVEDGKNGFLVPIRNPEALAEKLAWCAEHRSALPEMGEAAQASAARVTWLAYGRTILTALGGNSCKTGSSARELSGHSHL
jgi:glycosyltransferase involved in cell wall biosynthesis